MAALCAAKISGRPGEGPRDHAAYTIRAMKQFARDLAHAVEIGNRNYVLVRGNLKYAVAGGVHDRESCARVFFAQFLDDLRSCGGLVPKRAAPDSKLEFRNQRFWKAVRIHGEG